MNFVEEISLVKADMIEIDLNPEYVEEILEYIWLGLFDGGMLLLKTKLSHKTAPQSTENKNIVISIILNLTVL